MPMIIYSFFRNTDCFNPSNMNWWKLWPKELFSKDFRCFPLSVLTIKKTTANKSFKHHKNLDKALKPWLWRAISRNLSKKDNQTLNNKIPKSRVDLKSRVTVIFSTSISYLFPHLQLSLICHQFLTFKTP